MTVHRRFIAGVVCPRCASMDTTFVYRQLNKTVRACTDCDFEEFEDAVSEIPGRELPTRVNQTVDKTLVEIQTIKFIDDKKGE